MKLRNIGKKGSVFDELGSIGIGLASLAITLVVVFVMLSQTGANTTVSADGNASRAVQTLTESAGTIPEWVPLIVVAFVGALLLSLVYMYVKR